MESGGRFPELVEVLSEKAALKIYWHQKDSLYIRDGKLCRRRADGVEQTLIPKALREDFIRMAHTGMTGGYLGIL